MIEGSINMWKYSVKSQLQPCSQYFEVSSRFSLDSLHHRWNEIWLLSTETEYLSSLKSCKMTEEKMIEI